MTNPDASNALPPETLAAEKLRRHLEEIARERDRAHQALQEREAELVRIQRIARVGGVEINFRTGYRKRSPEYLILHGLPPEAVICSTFSSALRSVATMRGISSDVSPRRMLRTAPSAKAGSRKFAL